MSKNLFMASAGIAFGCLLMGADGVWVTDVRIRHSRCRKLIRREKQDDNVS